MKKEKTAAYTLNLLITKGRREQTLNKFNIAYIITLGCQNLMTNFHKLNFLQLTQIFWARALLTLGEVIYKFSYLHIINFSRQYFN